MRSFNGTSYLSTSTFNNSVALSYPLSISAWFVLADTATGRVANVNSAGGSSVLASILTNYPSAGFISNQWYGNNSLPASKNKAGVGTLNHCLIVVGAVYHTIYLNGVRGASATTTGSVSSCTYMEIGKLNGQQGFNGLVSDVAVWQDVLNDSDAMQLFVGESPLTIRQGKLLEYYPLRDNDKAHFNRAGNALTAYSSPVWNARQKRGVPLLPQRWAQALTHYTLACDAGSFTLTGIDAGLYVGRAIAAEAGAFTLTGIDAGLTATRTIAAETGAFVLTGIDAGLSVGFTLTCDAGSFALTGIDAGLTAARLLAAEAGAFTLTGNDANLNFGYVMVASAGSFTLTGIDASLTATRTLTAGTGTFTLTGNAATLTHTVPLEDNAGPGSSGIGPYGSRLRNPLTKMFKKT